MSFEEQEIIGITRILAAPETSSNLLLTTLKMIHHVSAHASTSVTLLSAEKFAILNELIRLLSMKTMSDEHCETILTILVNTSADNETISARILESEAPIVECAWHGASIKLKKDRLESNVICLRYAQLFANISRHHSKFVCKAFEKHWPTYISDILDMLSMTLDFDEFDYFGYVLMNLSIIPSVREKIARQNLPKLLPLLAPKIYTKRKFCATNIVYNISFDDHLHGWLLNDVEEILKEDAFISAIVEPLADSDDVLCELEMDKLPLQLQYYDGRRETDLTIVCKLVETLYQLCSSKIGRETLRTKGIYAILRELDNSYFGSTALKTNSMILDGVVKQEATLNTKAKSEINAANKLIDLKNNYAEKDKDTEVERFKATLHALIGVLIRYESEMCISEETFSLRHLTDEMKMDET